MKQKKEVYLTIRQLLLEGKITELKQLQEWVDPKELAKDLRLPVSRVNVFFSDRVTKMRTEEAFFLSRLLKVKVEIIVQVAVNQILAIRANEDAGTKAKKTPAKRRDS